MKKTYNKLVRDKIPEIILANNGEPTTRILDDQEYLQELIAKIGEEGKEFKDNPSVEELADIEEIVRALADALDISYEELEKVRLKKAKARGAFKKKIFLKEVYENPADKS